MRKYNLKREIAYGQGKVNAYGEVILMLQEEFVLSDYHNTSIGRVLSSVELMRGAATKLLKELEEKRDK